MTVMRVGKLSTTPQISFDITEFILEKDPMNVRNVERL